VSAVIVVLAYNRPASATRSGWKDVNPRAGRYTGTQVAQRRSWAKAKWEISVYNIDRYARLVAT
jgi:hypothetical protein